MRRLVVVTGMLALVAGGMIDAGAAGGQTLPPTVAVAPFSNLVHRQEVRVGGFGFAPHAQLAFSQCVAGVDDISDCDLSTSKFVQANQYGAFKSRTIVKRLIRVGGETVDCAAAAGTCVIGGGYPDGSAGNQFPLHFDPEGPLPSPSITATPSTNLQHLQKVAVTGSGFSPGEAVGFRQCDASAVDDCSFFPIASVVDADASGAFSTSVTTRRLVRTGSGTLDCGEAPEHCVLAATNLADSIEKATQPLSFDPAGSLPPTTLTVEPATGLVHLQKVTVSGAGFDSDLPDSNAGVLVVQCVAGEDPFAFPNGCAGVSVAPVQDPTLWAIEAWVRRTIVGADGVPVDCAAAPGTCELIAVSHLDPAISGTVPLAFDPSAPLPPPPTMKARPKSNLRGGQAITVTGEGFTPHATIGIAQCRNNATDGQDDCDLSTTTFTQADATGSIATTFVVRGRMNTANGPVNCKAAPKTCAVGGANINDTQGEQAGAGRLTFRRITG